MNIISAGKDDIKNEKGIKDPYFSLESLWITSITILYRESGMSSSSSPFLLVKLLNYTNPKGNRENKS